VIAVAEGVLRTFVGSQARLHADKRMHPAIASSGCPAGVRNGELSSRWFDGAQKSLACN